MNKDMWTVIIGLVGLIALMVLLSASHDKSWEQPDTICIQLGYDEAVKYGRELRCIRKVSIIKYKDEVCEFLGMPNGKLIVTGLGSSAYCEETIPFPE